MSESDSETSVSVERLYECKQCNTRVTAAEKDAHRRTHRRQGRRSQLADEGSRADSEITLFRPVPDPDSPKGKKGKIVSRKTFNKKTKNKVNNGG